jgi:aspartyl/asparaginyl beta-hydroxylase (cupin superfamily)
MNSAAMNLNFTSRPPKTPPPVLIAESRRQAEASRRTFRKWAYNRAMEVMRLLARVVARSSRVPTTPFMSEKDFAWVKPLEGRWREIRRELEGVLTYRNELPAFHEINGDATNIGHDDWKSYFFYGFGRKSEASCRRCPTTTALIEQVPGMTTAFFSILGPGVKLPPHKGPWKGFIRYHLGLVVPEAGERCGIEVGGEKAYWREGKSLIFDDTYEHRVWNDTTSTRVVLFLDVVRPCRFPGSLVNKAVIHMAGLTPFIQDSIRRHERWERKFEGVRRALR